MTEMYEKSAKEIRRLLLARHPALFIHSEEEEPVIRVIRTINDMFRLGNQPEKMYQIFSWSLFGGFYIEASNGKVPLIPKGNTLEEALETIYTFSERSIFIIQDAHLFLGTNRSNVNDPMDVFRIKELIRKITLPFGEFGTQRYQSLAKNLKHIIFVSSIGSVPEELNKLLTTIDFQLPGKYEIEQILNRASESGLSFSDRNAIINASLGLTESELINVYEKSKINPEHPKKIHPRDVYLEKKQIVKKSGKLTFEDSSISLDDIGGLSPVVDWVKKRVIAFDEEIQKKWHLDLPKGVLFTGIPGCGKSLLAKAIPNYFNMPLLRLDMGSIFGKWVGDSENNIRNAIRIAESVSPCVLWIDEIEKGMPGNQGTSHETTERVFQTFLTWMQEKTSSVFVVATANNMDKLPPELMRKGRFDEIFFVDLPEEKERLDIFKIHLTKKKQSLSQFQLSTLVENTQGFSGAEIQTIINEALFSAATTNVELTNELLFQEIKKTTPLSQAMSKKIMEIRNYAKEHNIRMANREAP